MLRASLITGRCGQTEIYTHQTRLNRNIPQFPSIFNTDQVQRIHFGRTFEVQNAHNATLLFFEARHHLDQWPRLFNKET